ncbi:hypothetical protein [Marinobacter sp. AN1]|uniref:hypothetical protein n=1 Tax=Marinobacter sp. AN1 TaxID=2886046 RepID=UPI00222E0B93|nr:hypothetical protein [Marinobacter sp. AN1]UZD65812.1 hypothetical protein LJ360_00115 [Marinobacter sp. AN1]
MRMLESASRWLAMAGLVVLLGACGGGGGGGSDGANSPAPPESDDPTPPEDENHAPTASVQFPLSGSLTTGTDIPVRGTATDPDGDAITAVTVHGVLAETDDGFATWQVPNVPLQAGTNTLEGVVQDARGGVGRFSLTLEQVENPGPALHSPKGLALDTVSGEARLLVIDQVLDALFALDLSDGPTLGHRTILGQTGGGHGTNFLVPSQVVVDTAENRALVLDRSSIPGTGKVIAVDLATLARTELVSGFSFASSLALDTTNNRLLIGDSGTDRLLTVDLDNLAAGTTNNVSIASPVSIDVDPASPDRALVVDTVVGIEALFEVDLAGKSKRRVATFNDPKAVRFDPAGGSELAVLASRENVFSDNLFSVNLGNGSTTLLSGLDEEDTVIGTGSRLTQISDMLFDPRDANRLWVADSSSRAVFVVNLGNGDRLALGSRLGSGPDFLAPAAVALLPNADARQPMVVVLDDILNDGSSEIYGVNLAPGDTFGDRVTLSGFDADNPNQVRGQGPRLLDARNLVADTANNRLLVADASANTVVAVDPESGDRSTLSGDDVGEGPTFDNIRALAVDVANNRVLVAQRGSLVAVDLDSGDRTLISTGNGSGETDIGTGPAIRSPISVALDARNNRLLVLLFDINDEELGGLISVDLSSGDRTVISDPATGSGNILRIPVSVALDAANNRALVLDSAFGFSIDQVPPSIVAVDLSSGDRSVVSGHDRGPDGEFDSGDDQLIGGGSPFNPTSTPADAAFDAEARILYVTDQSTGSLIAVDVDSGNRALVSGFGF